MVQTKSALSLDTAQFGGALGESTAMRQLFAILEEASTSDASILLEGESGVGKAVLAKAIHSRSKRTRGPFVVLDRGAMTESLIEAAAGGTLFLDEVDELSPERQSRLLRALDARDGSSVGEPTPRFFDVRIVAATNRNLRELVEKGAFRADLYDRLAEVQAVVPPLRERREDVVLLARAFLNRMPGFEDARIPREMEDVLASHAWPGNVRELEGVIARYAVLGTATVEDLPAQRITSPLRRGPSRTSLRFRIRKHARVSRRLPSRGA
jgi:DNA-binding NtrC family response regulator